MQIPKYLRPVRDQKNYEAGVGERAVRKLIYWPVILLLCLPAAAVMAAVALSFGLLFLKFLNIVETAIIDHDWLMLILIALAAAAILLLWKLAYVIYRYFIL